MCVSLPVHRVHKARPLMATQAELQREKYHHVRPNPTMSHRVRPADGQRRIPTDRVARQMTGQRSAVTPLRPIRPPEARRPESLAAVAQLDWRGGCPSSMTEWLAARRGRSRSSYGNEPSRAELTGASDGSMRVPATRQWASTARGASGRRRAMLCACRSACH